MWPFKKKVVIEPKITKPPRVAIHLIDGRTIVHYAKFRTISELGLTLHNEKGGGKEIAMYAPNTWHSITVGKRNIQKDKKQ
jgi:hypothetical protein